MLYTEVSLTGSSWIMRSPAQAWHALMPGYPTARQCEAVLAYAGHSTVNSLCVFDFCIPRLRLAAQLLQSCISETRATHGLLHKSWSRVTPAVWHRSTSCLMSSNSPTPTLFLVRRLNTGTATAAPLQLVSCLKGPSSRTSMTGSASGAEAPVSSLASCCTREAIRFSPTCPHPAR